MQINIIFLLLSGARLAASVFPVIILNKAKQSSAKIIQPKCSCCFHQNENLVVKSLVLTSVFLNSEYLNDMLNIF